MIRSVASQRGFVLYTEQKWERILVYTEQTWKRYTYILAQK